MKRILFLLTIALYAPIFCSQESQNSTPISFSQAGIAELITHLAQGNQVKELTALDDITSMEQVVYAVEEIALMRATGTKITEEKVEKFRKLEEKLVQLISVLRAAVNLKVEHAPQEHAQKMQEISQQIEALVIPLMACKQIIAMCAEENIVPTVQYAFEVVYKAHVSHNIRHAFTEQVEKNNADNQNIQEMCNDVKRDLIGNYAAWTFEPALGNNN